MPQKNLKVEFYNILENSKVCSDLKKDREALVKIKRIMRNLKYMSSRLKNILQFTKVRFQKL